jgi:hypothetical protein
MLDPTSWIIEFGRGYETHSRVKDVGTPPGIKVSVSVNGRCFDYCLVAVVMSSCVNMFTI